MDSIDKRNKFEQNIFSYHESKGKAFIYWQDKLVVVLKDKKAQKFINRVKGLDDREAQLVMAKFTGNFKRGNERQ